jgi:hypothetical protein
VALPDLAELMLVLVTVKTRELVRSTLWEMHNALAHLDTADLLAKFTLVLVTAKTRELARSTLRETQNALAHSDTAEPIAKFTLVLISARTRELARSTVQEPQNAPVQPDSAEPLANPAHSDTADLIAKLTLAIVTIATTELARSYSDRQRARATPASQEPVATKPITVSETRAPVTAHVSARVRGDTSAIVTMDSSVSCVMLALHKLQ